VCVFAKCTHYPFYMINDHSLLAYVDIAGIFRQWIIEARSSMIISSHEKERSELKTSN
jgi:hypothetical protein